MRGKARKLCTMLLLVVLCLAAHLQGAGSRGEKGDGDFGRGGRGGDAVVVRSKRSRRRHHDYDYDDDHHNHTSSAAEPRGHGLNWRVSGATATLAAALIW